MPKILFINKYPTCLRENLIKKFNGQMEACKQLGYEVWYINWDGKYFSLIKWNGEEKVQMKRTIAVKKHAYYHTLFFSDLYRVCAKILKTYKFDKIYMRYMPFMPSIRRLLKRIPLETKFIMEIPSYPFENEQSKEKRVARRIGFIISDRYRKEVFSRVDLFAVCGEKVDGEAYGRPAINIVNGSDVNSVPLREPHLDAEEIHILLLASMCYWHAYDRVIDSLRRYSGNVKVILHFVGNDGDGSLSTWKETVKKYNLDGNVFFYGALYEEELDTMVNQCDVGVGSLGLYRENLDDAATLKAREYMSRGIPFIYAGKDQALEKSHMFTMRVSNNDDDIDMKEVIDFALRFKREKDIPSKMRLYAKEYMSWENVFKNIFEIFTDSKKECDECDHKR